MFKIQLLLLCFAVGILRGFVQASEDAKSTTVSLEASATSTSLAPATLATTATTDSLNDATKDKRQVGKKDTQIYPNHRSATAEDDPEDGQETIYGPKPNQFLIRPLSPHQHQQHEEHQQTQLRNYPVTIRPHSQQLLEQSQEIQHFAYLQDLTRNHPSSKTAGATSSTQRQGKAQLKKIAASRVAVPLTYNSAATTATATEEAEQRYAYAVQPQVSQPQPHQFHQSTPYRIAAAGGQPQHQQLQQQQLLQPQQYQIIPEEQFLKILEEELQARAYQEEQASQQQQQQQHQQQQHNRQQQQHQQQRQYQVQAQAQRDSANKIQLTDSAERSAPPGLGSYRQRIADEPNDAYIQYIPRPQAGPKYLPEPQEQQHVGPTAPSGPQRLAYYTPPQLQYKALPNHPLAKSSLEKEIEKLLVANKPDALQFEDNSNEPSAVVNHQHHHQSAAPHQQQQLHRHAPRPLQHPKTAYISSTTPNVPQVDANNQPFIPSLFQFSQYQQPTPIYSTQAPQKLGPVVYPTTAPTSQPAQPSQYYYQEARPTPSVRPYRAKQYGNKIPSPSPSLKSIAREKEASKLQQKYSQPYEPYDYERQPQSQTGPVQFYPSQRDPTEQQAQPSIRPTLAAPRHSEPPPLPPTQPQPNYRPYLVPAAAPSQSSIYVSQSTGIKTASRPVHKAAAAKTAEDVRQLHLPQPGGKPLTQAEFQALIDAGYPVTAIPVPVPVPYEQYIKENPEYRNQPLDYPLMRLAQQYAPQAPQSQHQHRLQQQHQHQQRSLAAPSEPAPKIVASPNETKTATGIGGGGITYLRPIEHDQQQQSRRPRDEQDTAVEGTAQKET